MGANVVFDSIEDNFSIYDIHNENKNILDEIMNQFEINDDLLLSVDRFVSSFSSKADLHSFCSVKCNFYFLSKSYMR